MCSKPDTVEDRARGAQRFFARQRLQPEGDVVQHREMRKQREILKHQPDAAAFGRHEAVGPGDFNFVDQDAARRRPLDARNDAQQRGLAAARRPEQAHDFARLHVEIDAVQGAGVVVVLGDALELHARGKRGRRARLHRRNGVGRSHLLHAIC